MERCAGAARTGNAAAHGADSTPGEELEEVVRDREVKRRGKAIAHRYRARRGPSRAESADGQMCVEVGELSVLKGH